jgi:hypothetical protein
MELAELVMGDDLDHGYIKVWSQRLGLTSLWQQVLDRVASEH